MRRASYWAMGGLLGLSLGLAGLLSAPAKAEAGLVRHVDGRPQNCRVIRERVVVNTYPRTVRVITRRVCRPAPAPRHYRPHGYGPYAYYRPAPPPRVVRPHYRHNPWRGPGHRPRNHVTVRFGW